MAPKSKSTKRSKPAAGGFPGPDAPKRAKPADGGNPEIHLESGDEIWSRVFRTSAKSQGKPKRGPAVEPAVGGQSSSSRGPAVGGQPLKRRKTYPTGARFTMNPVKGHYDDTMAEQDEYKVCYPP